MASFSCNGSHRPGLLHLAFNQDASCIAAGTSEGIRVFSLDTHAAVYKHAIGAVRCGVWCLFGVVVVAVLLVRQRRHH